MTYFSSSFILIFNFKGASKSFSIFAALFYSLRKDTFSAEISNTFGQ